MGNVSKLLNGRPSGKFHLKEIGRNHYNNDKTKLYFDENPLN